MTLHPAAGQTTFLPEPYAAAVSRTLDEWQRDQKVSRLWDRDATLWTGRDEGSWLGWLDTVDDQISHLSELSLLAAEIRREEFQDLLLLGMGGSSLCPEVLASTFGQMKGFPPLHVLDSTDPAEVRSAERRVDLGRTLVIVSSKSGSTLEPNIFKQYFFQRIGDIVGGDRAGGRFTCITDPGSRMQAVAVQDRFRHIFAGVPAIGGRYSALSAFGIVPAAMMGIDVERFLSRARVMVRRCGPGVAAHDNPGVVLGSTLGVLGTHGRDKVTLVTSPGLGSFGAWLEQLLAESTGKSGRALIPVDGEPLGLPSVYGDDRVFVSIELGADGDAAIGSRLEALERANHPVVRIRVDGRYDLGQEFFRWEIATAVAGSILGINPFDQPDVEASKVATRALTDEFERTGRLPDEAPIFAEDGFELFADPQNETALKRAVGSVETLERYLGAHLSRSGHRDYVAILAFVERNDRNRSVLEAMRHTIRDHHRVATSVGFGPRYLHSTGQAYKGGPNTGVFLHITSDDELDVPVPGQRYTFGIVKAAQARGDFQVLAERGRRLLRIYLSRTARGGLERLQRAVAIACGPDNQTA